MQDFSAQDLIFIIVPHYNGSTKLEHHSKIRSFDKSSTMSTLESYSG